MEDREKRFEGVTPDQAFARIHTFPAQMAYEAKYALQLIRETELDSEQVVQIVEPLAKAVGWAEALAYAFELTTEREAVQQITSGVLQSQMQKAGSGR